MDKVSEYISKHDDWRGLKLAGLRVLINDAAPELKEDFKWGVPVWEYQGLVCAISAFKDHVKMNFFKGAYITRTNNVFNSGLDSKEHRSINLSEHDKIDKLAIRKALKAAIVYNQK